MMEKQGAGNGKHTKTNEFLKDTQLHENDVYLLRLVNSTEKTGEICPAGKDGIIYIICCLPIQKDTLPAAIETVLHCLKPFGFPDLRNPCHRVTFEITCDNEMSRELE